jgi:outer membrane protein assembly factor BamB
MTEPRTQPRSTVVVPALAAGLAVVLVAFLVLPGRAPRVSERVPEPPRPDGQDSTGFGANAAANPGTLLKGTGAPGKPRGDWPQFRGPARTNLAASASGLSRAWPEGGPRKVWEIRVGEGHAGPAVWQGRVYLMDYDRERQEDAIRCLSLDDGREIWRYTYSVVVKRNHGMSRTVPAVADGYVVTLGPKCHVCCLRAESGELVWRKDLAREYGATVPPWYAGQCPLLDAGAAVLAPGGNPLLLAVDLASGETRWQTPNPEAWAMTHSSVAVLEHAAGRQYLYCSTRGVLGVSAADGRILWQKPDWRISIANIPTPVPVGREQVLLSGGYNAGAALVEVVASEGSGFGVKERLRTPATVFGSDQQTPIVRDGLAYGVIPSGELVCLDLATGTQKWGAGRERRFGLGPYLMAEDLVYALGDQRGELTLFAVGPDGCQVLATAKVLNGHDAWAPMALVGGRLLVRDLETLVCLEVGTDTNDKSY